MDDRELRFEYKTKVVNNRDSASSIKTPDSCTAYVCERSVPSRASVSHRHGHSGACSGDHKNTFTKEPKQKYVLL